MSDTGICNSFSDISLILQTSIIELEISEIELQISLNELEISKIEFWGYQKLN